MRREHLQGRWKSKPGKFELANKGTQLLDAIGEMSPHMQVKLLHVLQDGYFSRLGTRTPTKVDVQILAATNIDMQKVSLRSAFVKTSTIALTLTLTIPPLRERGEEIPFMISKICARGPRTYASRPSLRTG
jgi:two-component system response regulator AtoC